MPEADLLLENGVVITLDRASRIAEAVAVRDGRILAVGPSAALSRDTSPATRRIDLRGRTVMPGFCDAHPHVDREGLKALGGLPISGLRSIAEIIEAVREATRTVQPGEWIVLMPLGSPPHNYLSRPEELTEGRFPNRYDLDAVEPDNPVYIRAVWGWWSHRPFPSVANSLALARSGITHDTSAPHNVEIVRDARGEPTGLFLERNYTPILEYTLFRGLPRFTQQDRVESIRLGVQAYSKAGTTAAFEGHGLTPAIIRAYREVQARGEMTLRMHTPLSVPSTVFDDGRLADLFSTTLGWRAGVVPVTTPCGSRGSILAAPPTRESRQWLPLATHTSSGRGTSIRQWTTRASPSWGLRPRGWGYESTAWSAETSSTRCQGTRRSTGRFVSGTGGGWWSTSTRPPQLSCGA